LTVPLSGALDIVVGFSFPVTCFVGVVASLIEVPTLPVASLNALLILPVAWSTTLPTAAVTSSYTELANAIISCTSTERLETAEAVAIDKIDDIEEVAILYSSAAEEMMAWMPDSGAWARTNEDRYGRRRRIVGSKVRMIGG